MREQLAERSGVPCPVPAAGAGDQGMYVVNPGGTTSYFPEQAPGLGAAQQLSLFPEVDPPLTHPWGNTLRKAYLCNSATKSIRPGDPALVLPAT